MNVDISTMQIALAFSYIWDLKKKKKKAKSKCIYPSSRGHENIQLHPDSLHHPTTIWSYPSLNTLNNLCT